jgi:murein L,D-transpeptidase YafK
MAPLLLVLCLVNQSGGEAKVTAIATRRQKDLTALLQAAHLSAPPSILYLRVFKEEKQLESWGGNSTQQPLVLLRRYPICAASGVLGPKRKEGDYQVPEGLYALTEFNPFSSFHLSLKINYPNASDKVRSDAKHPGGLIYLHGDCASVGCVAIEDGPIEEVYLLARTAKTRRIDIFPFRMSSERLEKEATPLPLWTELTPFYRRFEDEHRLVQYQIDAKSGAYVAKLP